MAQAPSKKKKGFRVFFRKKTNQVYWFAVVALFLAILGFTVYTLYTATKILNLAFRQPPKPAGREVRFDLQTAKSLERLNKVPPSILQPPPEASPSQFPQVTPSPSPKTTPSPATPSPLISPK